MLTRREYSNTLRTPMKAKYAIYCIICPVKKEPIYIGCTNNVYLKYVYIFSNEDNKERYAYVQSLLQLGKYPLIKVLHWTNDIKEARRLEEKETRDNAKKFHLFNKQMVSGYFVRGKHRFIDLRKNPPENFKK